MKWTTFYGAAIEISDLSHQHLSNILWYFNLVLDRKPTELIQLELNKRFGGIKLPYHPLVSFPYELDVLEAKGFIQNRLNSDVVVNGQWVGKILYN